MTKKSLDDLFRLPANDPTNDGPAPDLWQKLECRLDEKRGKKRRRGIRFLQTQTVAIALFLLLLAALFGWFFVKKMETRPENQPNEAPPKSEIQKQG